MTVGSSTRRVATAVLLAGGLSLAGCSSSGGGGGDAPSQAKIVNQLKKDPDFGPVLKEIPSSKSGLVVSCVAKAMTKGIDNGELTDFANGKKTLSQLKGKGGSSDKAAQAEAEKCVTSAVGGG